MQASLWYRMAAEEGDVEAQFALSAAYERGEGVPQDHVEAYAWFIVAEARTFVIVWNLLPEDRAHLENDRKRMAASMSTAQIDDAQKLACKYWASYRSHSEISIDLTRSTFSQSPRPCPFVVNPRGGRWRPDRR